MKGPVQIRARAKETNVQSPECIQLRKPSVGRAPPPNALVVILHENLRTSPIKNHSALVSTRRNYFIGARRHRARARDAQRVHRLVQSRYSTLGSLPRVGGGQVARGARFMGPVADQRHTRGHPASKVCRTPDPRRGCRASPRVPISCLARISLVTLLRNYAKALAGKNCSSAATSPWDGQRAPPARSPVDTARAARGANLRVKPRPRSAL